ncbi:hypothetical protein Q4493_15075 [Colwellia sp. 1_MG-2023]|uniref:hypothetical protein n=1 Tax=Colwellia sp. 1_MG-2023 TaxID=3062649 RepID=UPI0026E35922|nr:hypothetical protein [Colwellia sp. 1_MG-2023]MDO6447092.1 hypothetical protein [Colwellia sp. 1_MG-2023]
MDIFTTVLTKVRPTPIKPEKLRVKALKKDAETQKLKEDHDHVENHDLYFIKGKKQHDSKQDSQQAKQGQGSNDETTTIKAEEDEFTDENIIPTESVITDKQDILHPKKAHDDDEENIKHLDIFI